MFLCESSQMAMLVTRDLTEVSYTVLGQRHVTNTIQCKQFFFKIVIWFLIKSEIILLCLYFCCVLMNVQGSLHSWLDLVLKFCLLMQDFSRRFKCSSDQGKNQRYFLRYFDNKDRTGCSNRTPVVVFSKGRTSSVLATYAGVNKYINKSDMNNKIL